MISLQRPDEAKTCAPVLIFSYGNPSRGDDALGPEMFDLLAQYLRENSLTANVDLLTDFQLQIEHAIDLENREVVLFIDADMSCFSPCEFFQLHAQRDRSYTTHAMSPSAVMAVYQQINQCQAPEAYMLTIRGYEFSLGQAISGQAQENLVYSFALVKRLLSLDPGDWKTIVPDDLKMTALNSC